ncbi:MAG: hypothetical protein MRZ70_09400 [Prevotella sp.]|nr:hypothetical protein [Prevotella sp.]
MNKILRISMIAVLALIANFSFGQTVVTFTAETDKGSFDATQTGTGAGADKITKNGVTIQTSNGAFAATDYNTKAAQYRIYKSAKFTVSSTVGNITKVVITCITNGSAKNGPGCFTGDNYKASTGKEGTWSGNAASLTLTASSNQVRATKVEVTIGGETGGETPTPPAEETKAENIAAFKALTSGTTATLTLKNAQVVYKNVYTTKKGATNTEYYVRDASGAIQFFNTGLDLKVNQILNGTVEVKYSPYNDMPEAAKSTNTSAEKLTITDGEVAVPTKVTVADLATDKYLCDLVTVENVNITTEEEDTHTNNYLVSGTDKVMIYDKFKTNVTISEGEGYDVTGVLVTAKLSGNIVKELAPISAPVATGINNISAAVDSADAPVYNLSGQRVGKNAKGVLIKNGKKYVVK